MKDKKCSLHLYCQDPAYFTTEGLNKCFSSLLFSATLEPMDYFKQVLYQDKKPESLSLGSPFPQSNLRVINRNDLDTRYHYRKRGLSKMVEAIHVLREEYPGHQMAFFPSFAYLNEAAELWRLSYDEPIILQRNSMDLQERQNMIDLFEEKGSHLIFAVIGGIFSEGLDLEGDKLSALSIVSVGLPSICLEREWIKEHYDKKNRHGFDYAYRYPGWNRILQAAGRLIRSETDRGIIQLLGRRFNTPFYRRMFPKHWGNSLSLDNPLDQAEAVASFRKEMHV